jgi:hypothetical protein
VRWIKEAGSDRHRKVEISMVAFPMVVTRDRDARAAAIAERLVLTASEILARSMEAVASFVDRPAGT